MSTSALATTYVGYVSVKGQKQGQFKGESAAAARAKQWMDLTEFKWGVVVPTDTTTGSVTGRRKHEPVCFTKIWGPASPQFFAAMASNEALTEVDFEFVKPDPSGKEFVFQTVKLTNAQVVQDRQRLGAEIEGSTTHLVVTTEEICFAYQRIDITNNDGHTTSTDTWQ
ncbi:MAG TPA: type VI secretion system tube protein TssD [Polyangiaceae bacterium]|nr:type VI secretion system tube protein TssD [Polyangiaceae bacterium]